MSTLSLERRVSELVRETRKNATGNEPHQLREALQETVWQYVNTKIPTKTAAINRLRQIGMETDRLPPPGAELFTIRSSREAQSATSDAHRMLAAWLMGLTWEQLKPQ